MKYTVALSLLLLTAMPAIAAETAGEKANAGLPQFDISTFPSQLFWLAITFIVLYLFFSKKALPEISSTIDNRKTQIESDLTTAEKVKAEAMVAQEEFENGLIEAREHAARFVQETQASISKSLETETDKFRSKMESEIKALETRLETSKNQAMDEMNTIAADVASSAAQKIVGISTNINDAKAVVESLHGQSRKAA